MSRRPRRPILQPIGRWQPGQYAVASGYGVDMYYGWLWGSLAMYKLWDGSPKGRRPPGWNLTHCGTGHRVCIIEAHQEKAFGIADQIADLTDWSFDGLEGWKNTDPDLMERLRALGCSYGKAVTFGSGGQHVESAQVIAYARAG